MITLIKLMCKTVNQMVMSMNRKKVEQTKATAHLSTLCKSSPKVCFTPKMPHKAASCLKTCPTMFVSTIAFRLTSVTRRRYRPLSLNHCAINQRQQNSQQPFQQLYLVAELDAIELVCVFEKFRPERRRNKLRIVRQFVDHI